MSLQLWMNSGKGLKQQRAYLGSLSWLLYAASLARRAWEESIYIHTRHCQMYADTPSKSWIRLFQPPPVAERCIKSSTQPCNLQRQTLAVEWATLKSSDFQCGTVMGYHLYKSVCQISALLDTARAAPVNCKCCYCEVEMSRSNNNSAAKW